MPFELSPLRLRQVRADVRLPLSVAPEPATRARTRALPTHTAHVTPLRERKRQRGVMLAP